MLGRSSAPNEVYNYPILLLHVPARAPGHLAMPESDLLRYGVPCGARVAESG
jgi:hypothetical protein